MASKMELKRRLLKSIMPQAEKMRFLALLEKAHAGLLAPFESALSKYEEKSEALMESSSLTGVISQAKLAINEEKESEHEVHEQAVLESLENELSQH